MREDFAYIESLQMKLFSYIYNIDSLRGTLKGKQLAIETEKWVGDVYLDKLFEIRSKISKLFKELHLSPRKELQVPQQQMENYLQRLAYPKDGIAIETEKEHQYCLDNLGAVIRSYEIAFEQFVAYARNSLYYTDWEAMKKINPEDYVEHSRKRYVSAREELEKAIQAVKNSQWDEVLNHLRTSIDLAIREKFGFTKIHPMRQFLVDAEKYGLPLPSYTMLYDYVDEGSQRIHSGKLNTPFECQKALEFVAGFIDQLELVDISDEKINEFKQKSPKVVE